MNRSKAEWLQAIADYPLLPGVYIMRDVEDAVIYVGKANKIQKRLHSYFVPHIQHPKTEILVKKIARIEYILTESPLMALVVEQDLIKKYQPKYNILLKDDKTYPYVMLSGGTFPRLAMVRGSLARLKNVYPDATFLGPFPIKMRAYETLEWLQKTLMLRNCRDYDFNNRSRPCLQYQIERCSAPCVGYVTADAYQEQAQLAREFLLKNNDPLRNTLAEMMHKASENLDYESATRYRDMLAFVEHMYPTEYTRAQGSSIDVWDGMLWHDTFLCGVLEVRGGMLSSVHFFEPMPYKEEGMWDSVLCEYYHGIPRESFPDAIRWPEYTVGCVFSLWFKEHYKRSIGTINRKHLDQWYSILHNNLIEKSMSHDRLSRVLPVEDYRAFLSYFSLKMPWIIAVDISHTQGSSIIGAVASFKDGTYDKKGSITYPLQLTSPGDDIEAMRLLAEKIVYLTKRRRCVPDMIVVDGAVPQLRCFIDVFSQLHNHVVLVAVSKGPLRRWGAERLYQYCDGHIDTLEGLEDSVKYTTLRIRDASHKLANDTHAKMQSTQQLPKRHKSSKDSKNSDT